MARLFGFSTSVLLFTIFGMPGVTAAKVEAKPSGTVDTQIVQAKVQGYSGEQCENCGSVRVRQNGTCKVCKDCGMTTGCS